MSENKIIFHEKPGFALTKQRMNGDYSFPFSLNPTIGCLFGCRYCYLQQFPFNRWTEFGKEVKVKTWMPEKLDRELVKYQELPQHLKRVQVGPACECFLPLVLNKTKRELGRDIMAEILDTFERHWHKGNRWMLHLVTKSHLVVQYLEILSRMNQMVQVEMTLICLDEDMRRQYERHAPSIGKRLRVIQKLAQAGVFVRIMAMPLVCDEEEALELRRVAFDHGAKAFKHKGLNYFDKEDLLNGVVEKKKRRKDVIDMNLLVESGEAVDGQTRKVLMPIRRWKGFEVREMPILRSGYSALNEIDWGHLI